MSRDEELYVKDQAGQDRGRVGGPVRLGGGEFDLGFAAISESDARLLRTRCPGKYWIVARG